MERKRVIRKIPKCLWPMEFACADANGVCRMFERVSDDIMHNRLGLPSPKASPRSKSNSPTLFTFDYIPAKKEKQYVQHVPRLPRFCFSDFHYRVFLPPSYYTIEPRGTSGQEYWSTAEADQAAKNAGLW